MDVEFILRIENLAKEMQERNKMKNYKLERMGYIIDQANGISNLLSFWHLERKKNILKKKMETFIIEFYMLNPTENCKENLLDTENNEIIQDIVLTFYSEFEHRDPKKSAKYYEMKGRKEKIKQLIINCATEKVNDLIKLIQDAPEKINIDETNIAGFNKTCIDPISLDDGLKLHGVLEDLDYVIFIQPAEFMRPGSMNPVDYKYLALTYTKKYIKDWLNEKKRIEYCDTDPDNKLYPQKTPYLLSPLDFNCNPAYVKLWEILHILHSKQRIFYVLPSHSEEPDHKCMKELESHDIVKICICHGDNCWKWDKNTCKIDASDEEKRKIQTECNMKKFEEYRERVGNFTKTVQEGQRLSKPGRLSQTKVSRSRTSPYKKDHT